MFLHKRSDYVEQTAYGFHIEDVRGDQPAFKRIYTAVIDADRCTVKVDCHTFLGSRMESGELTQPNGRWLLFDPRAIADKILDPVLLPKIETVVRAMLMADAQFRASDPDSFVDDRGFTWKRQS